MNTHALLTAAMSGLLAGALTACGGEQAPPPPDVVQVPEALPAPAPDAASPTQAAPTQAAPAEGDQPAKAAQHACRGMNECKSQGGCHVQGKHACGGLNECKGMGGCCTMADRTQCPKHEDPADPTSTEG